MKKNNKKSIRKDERKLKWNKAKKIIENGKRGKYRNILFAYEISERWKFRINLSNKINLAVNRNYIKRMIREVYRTSKPKLDEPINIVFTVIDNLENIDFHKFRTKYLNTIKNELYK